MKKRSEMLLKLINERFDGSQVEFCRKAGKKEAQVTQWLNGYRNMKDSTAREIESILGLPNLYFEDIGSIATAKELRLIEIFRSVDDVGVNTIMTVAESLMITQKTK